MNERMEREIDEAIDAAEYALDCLYNAQDALNSAGNWGLVDMFGGGMFTTMFKHSKINDAKSELESAKRALRTLSRELRDVDRHINLNIDMGDFLTFADYFFDGFIADWMVQSKISDAKRQVNDAIEQVEYIRRKLLAL